jgi:hypothetical protein
MELENLIKDTFAAHEHETPESAPVLSAARRRIHRTRFVRSRPIMVAAGVAALAVAAVTVVALNRPVDQTQVAAAPQNIAPAPAKPAIADVKMPFTLGWLPPGKPDYVARRINIGATGDGNPNTSKPVYDGEYLLDVKNGHQTLLVDVQEMRMMQITEASFKSGPGRPVTIDGWPGVESSKSGGPGGYELYLTSPHDGVRERGRRTGQHRDRAPADRRGPSHRAAPQVPGLHDDRPRLRPARPPREQQDLRLRHRPEQRHQLLGGHLRRHAVDHHPHHGSTQGGERAGPPGPRPQDPLPERGGLGQPLDPGRRPQDPDSHRRVPVRG